VRAPPRPTCPPPAARPAGEDWIHEIKFDSYRTLLAVDRGQARALTRDGHDWSESCVATRVMADVMQGKAASPAEQEVESDHHQRTIGPDHFAFDNRGLTSQLGALGYDRCIV
jgi:hypothetical protein